MIFPGRLPTAWATCTIAAEISWIPSSPITATASIQQFPPLVAGSASFEQFLLLFEGFFDAF